MLYFLLILSVCCCLLAAVEQSRAQAPQTNAVVLKPAMPPLPALGAVDTFRTILNLSPSEREKYLSTRTPEQRQIVELKLREYQALPADAREERLRELQVRLYVRQMIKMPGTNRAEYLKLLRPVEREMADSRLGEWDALSAEAQQQLLENEWAIKIMARARWEQSMYAPSQQSENDLARWRDYPPAKREEILSHFQRFCEDLDEGEKSRVLNVLSDKERQQMRLTLQTFERLPKAQRDRCLQGFRKFAELAPEERAQFLVNANHWQNMTPKERQNWRFLVSKASLLSRPPLPPGAQRAFPPKPPTPVPAPDVLATND